MKLIDLEDSAQIVTKEYLDTKLDRLQISIDHLENKLDSRFNHLEARINKARSSEVAHLGSGRSLPGPDHHDLLEMKLVRKSPPARPG